MSLKANYHTHTTYCDGKQSAAEMAKAAYEKGFTYLGFSGHSYTAFDESYCMSRQDVLQYRKDIVALQTQYAGKMDIFCGVEQDFYGTDSAKDFDFVIGSVHYLFQNGRYHAIDESEDLFLKIVKEEFGGDYIKYAKCYFETVAQVVEKTNADFIGHFDLLTKFNEGGKHFDMTQKAYRFLALEAMEALLQTGKPFEINTGAMYRGLRTEPYPSYDLLQQLQKWNGKVLLSSDSHDGNSLGFQFAEIKQALQEFGFRVVHIWTKQGWKEVPLSEIL